MLLWDKPIVIKNSFEKLIQVFHIAIIVVDYIFDFFKTKKGDELIPFCGKLFQKVTKHNTFWSHIHLLLRVFPNAEAKKEEKRQQ